MPKGGDDTDARDLGVSAQLGPPRLADAWEVVPAEREDLFSDHGVRADMPLLTPPTQSEHLQFEIASNVQGRLNLSKLANFLDWTRWAKGSVIRGVIAPKRNHILLNQEGEINPTDNEASFWTTLQKDGRIRLPPQAWDCLGHVPQVVAVAERRDPTQSQKNYRWSTQIRLAAGSVAMKDELLKGPWW